MSKTAISVENLGKLYRLGEVGTGTISHDLNRWWARLRGKEDPFSKVGTVNDRTKKAKKGEHVWALKDVTFDIQQGEVLGIIGKNGAGKSTLLKLLSRITSPTTGDIRIKGRVASLLEVGTGFHPEMTGRENIYMNGTILGMTRKEITNKLDDIVDFAGIAKYLDTPTKRYSSGMQVRLAFAVAAFLEPEILIVDEVLAVGDAEFQKRAVGKMQEVSKGSGRTVLFVSHNMASVETICTKAALLAQGSLISQGETKVIVEKYLSSSLSNNKLNKNLPLSNDAYGVTIQDIKGSLINDVEGGLSLIIELTTTSEEKVRGIGCAITIKTDYGTLISQQGAALTGFIFTLEGSSTFTFKCRRIDQFLNSGDYTVDLSLVIPFKEVILEADQIVKFTIPEHDFYGNGLFLSTDLHGPAALKFELVE